MISCVTFYSLLYKSHILYLSTFYIRTLNICLKVIFLVVTKHVFKIAKFCYAQHTYIFKLKLLLLSYVKRLKFKKYLILKIFALGIIPTYRNTLVIPCRVQTISFFPYRPILICTDKSKYSNQPIWWNTTILFWVFS